MKTPTPETNAAIEAENVDPWDLAADLERRLTITRETLSAINNAEILRPDIHAEISRILKATAP